MSKGRKTALFLLLDPVWSLLGGQGSVVFYTFLVLTGKRLDCPNKTPCLVTHSNVTTAKQQ